MCAATSHVVPAPVPICSHHKDEMNVDVFRVSQMHTRTSAPVPHTKAVRQEACLPRGQSAARGTAPADVGGWRARRLLLGNQLVCAADLPARALRQLPGPVPTRAVREQAAGPVRCGLCARCVVSFGNDSNERPEFSSVCSGMMVPVRFICPEP
ncbi:hypothetical protein FQA47_013136 [Oryzias melastigma]|uniref:Uncharacterized protein n=1 Tax=Oryzias melastigma TaxID=30732 RepID=A0A834F5S5_ORYME|nr:hypothetical protein FQA47_013136 [Oryzias melastigma]